MRKILSNVLLFAVFFTATLPAFSQAGDGVFTLQRFAWYTRLDDPLLVRALLLVGAEADEGVMQGALHSARVPEVAQILLDAGAEMDEGILFWVRDVHMARFFLEAGAEVNVCNYDNFSPLMCSPDGDVTEVLLKAGAEADSQKLPTREPPGLSALHFAPDAKAVRLLIAAGVEVDVLTESHGLTPLCCARNAEVTRALMEAGADPCFQSKNGVTPLHHAQDAESVRMLLEAGADVNAESKSGVRPLLQMTRNRYRTCALHMDGPLPTMSYHCACTRRKPWDTPKDAAGLTADDRDQIARVKLLLAAGADANAVTEWGDTPLMHAHLTEITRMLLEAGAGTEGFGLSGKTALHLVETPEKVGLLLAAGASVEARDMESRTPLFGAYTPQCVRLMLEAGADPCAKDMHDRTPLFFARDAESVTLLLEAMRKSGVDEAGIKAALNTPAKTGQTAVVALCEYARQRNFGELLRVLVPAGADVNVVGERGCTPLMYADCEEAVKLLLDAGACVNVRDDEGRTPLHHVVLVLDAGAVRLMLAAGADVNAETKDGQTPLGMISNYRYCHSEKTPGVVKLLLAAGADVNRKDDFAVRMTNTPLHDMGNAEAVLMLLEAGADVNAVGKDGKTPLHTQRFSPEIVQALIAAGGDVNARDNNGRTPLFYAYRTSVAKILVEAGADVNAKDDLERTPLFYRIRAADREFLRLMTDAGADFHVQDKRGMTLLHEAVFLPQVRYLVAKGLDVNAKDAHGNTPLHVMKNLACMRILLAAGADVNARNNAGRTPYFEAGSPAARTLLLEAGADPEWMDNHGKTADQPDDDEQLGDEWFP